MILTALRNIGEVKSIPISQEELDIAHSEGVIKYIQRTYPKSSKTEKYLTLEFSLQPVIEFLEIIRNSINQSDFSNIETIDLTKNKEDFKIPKNGEKRERLTRNLIKVIGPKLSNEMQFSNFFDLFSVNIAEYDEFNYTNLRILKGNQSGTTIYYSPTMFCSTVKKKIKEFPLWKINLNHKFMNKKLGKLFSMFPSTINFTKINLNDKNSIWLYLISDLFLQALNNHISDDLNLQKMVYVVPVIDGKWPHEIEDFVKYYKEKTQLNKGNPGICEICGQEDIVEDGLTGELGFYTKNQEGFKLVGTNSGNLMCRKCIELTKIGYTYVRENFEYFIASRGKGKNPIMAYLIPVADKKFLENLIDGVMHKSNKSTIKDLLSIGNATTKSTQTNKKEEKDKEKDLLLTLAGIKENRYHFSFFLVLFYHPKGNASDFHNILDIFSLNYEKSIKLKNVIVDAQQKGNELRIKQLHHIFGIKAIRHISNLLCQKQIDIEKLCSDAYSKIKREFLKDAISKVGQNQMSSFDIKKFNWYLDLANRLDLINITTGIHYE